MHIVFLAFLALAAALVVAGVALWSIPAGMVVAGFLIAGLSALWFVDVGAAEAPE